MTGGRLGRRRKDRFRQLVRFLQPLGQFDPANRARRLIFLPCGTRNVATHDALDRKHVSVHHDHRPAPQLIAVLPDCLWVLVHIGRDEVIGDNVLEEVEPEKRDLGQDLTLVRDPRRQNVVEGRDAVCCHEQQAVVVYFINVANLPAGVQLEVGTFGTQQDGIKNLWAHGKKFYRQKTWRILAAQNFLSTTYVTHESGDAIRLRERTLTHPAQRENARQIRNSEDGLMWKS